MTSDAANRIAVRRYLSHGEQPEDGLVLATRVYGPFTYVIAEEPSGLIRWAFRVTAGGLFRSDVAHIIALEEAKAKEARGRISKISDAELVKAYKAALLRCELNHGRTPRAAFIQQLVAVWTELQRRRKA